MLRDKAAQEAADLVASEREAQARAQRALWETAQANYALKAFKGKEAERERQARAPCASRCTWLSRPDC
jgi:hypothetical protein